MGARASHEKTGIIARQRSAIFVPQKSVPTRLVSVVDALYFYRSCINPPRQCPTARKNRDVMRFARAETAYHRDFLLSKYTALPFMEDYLVAFRRLLKLIILFLKEKKKNFKKQLRNGNVKYTNLHLFE